MENKTHTVKRILACIMVVVMTVTAVPLSGFANHFYSYANAASDSGLNQSEITALKDILSSMCELEIAEDYSLYDDEFMSYAYQGITYKKNNLSSTKKALRVLVADLRDFPEGAQYSYSMKYYGNVINNSNWKMRNDNKDPKGHFENVPYFAIPAECIDSLVESIFNVSANHAAYEKYTYYYYNNMFYFQAYAIEAPSKSIDIVDIKPETNGTYTVTYKVYVVYGDDTVEDVCYLTSNVSKTNRTGKWRINSVKRNKSITDAYKSVLVDYVGTNFEFDQYMIYDIDKDGTTELIVYCGTCEADAEFRFYTFNGKDAIYIGDFGASHSWLYGINKTNGVYLYGAIQGFERLSKITKINNHLKITSVYEDRMVDEYTEPKNSLPYFERYDWSGIEKKATAKPLAVSSCKLSTTKYAYDGNTKTPAVTVKNNYGTKLTKGTDYTVTYASGRKNIGKYSVKVTFKGDYSGSKTLTFSIVPPATSKITVSQSTSAIKASWKAVSGVTGYKVFLYKGSKLVKSVVTKNTEYKFTSLSAGTSYQVCVKAYKTVNGEHFWSGETSLTTATKPGTPTLSVTAGAKKADLKWNKQAGATGYVVYMATSKNGTYKKIAAVKGSTKVSYTKTGLTKGKTYYFKVAAFKTADGKNIYSGYSAVKSAKIK